MRRTNKNSVLNKECHSRVSSSGIFTLDTQSGADPRLQASGMMTNLNAGQALPDNKGNFCPPCGRGARRAGEGFPRAFTLIELLVVVLIIGILAAVALPQYQQAIFRTKFNKVWSIVQQLRQMEELYYLENGTYRDNLVNSYVDFSQTCTGNGASFVCEGGFTLDINAGSISLWYSPLITPGMDQEQTFRAMSQTYSKSFSVCQYFAHHADYPNQVRCCHSSSTYQATCKKILSKFDIPYTE